MKVERIALTENSGSVLNMVELPDNVKKYCSIKPYLLADSSSENIPEDYAGSEPEAGFEVLTKLGIPKWNYCITL